MSTYYTAGGMPLAFTQEDFLVDSIVEKFGSRLQRTVSNVPAWTLLIVSGS